MSFTTLYVTFPNVEEAKRISKELITKKLAACANFFAINSMYVWKAEIKDENEIVAILKIPTYNHNVVEAEIKKMHSYECPCIMRLDASANAEYENWINEQCNN